MMDIAELGEWHAELASAASELAALARAPWPVGSDDSTVTLLRVVAWVAANAPQVESALAAQLMEALEMRR